MTRTALAVAALAVLGLLAVGCGAPAADLFEVQRAGRDRNANLQLVVSDSGTVRCNRREPQALEADQLLRARALARDLAAQAQLGLELPPGPRPTLRYRVRLESGNVAFTDASPQAPATFDRVVAFTTEVAEGVCGIER